MLSCRPVSRMQCAPRGSLRAGPQCSHWSWSEYQHPPSPSRALCQQTNSSSKGSVESKTFEAPSSTVGSTSLFEPKGSILVIPLQTSSLSGRVYLGNWNVLKIAFHLFQRTLRQGLVQPRLASDSLVAEAGLKIPGSSPLLSEFMYIYSISYV